MPAHDDGVDVLLWDFGDTLADERWGRGDGDGVGASRDPVLPGPSEA
jgi:hypothetical protein